MTTSRAGSDPRFLRSAALALLAGWIVLATPSAHAQEDAEVFLEDPVGYYLVSLVERGPYLREVTYEVRFRGSVEREIRVGPTDDGMPLFEPRSIATLSDHRPSLASLVSCIEEVCQPLETEQTLIGDVTAGGSKDAVRFVLAPGSRLAQRGEDLRLLASPGWVFLGGPDGTESPAVSVVLPRLGEADKAVLASHPVLRVQIAPMVEDAKSDQDGSLVDFEGGIHSFRRSHRLGLTYEGSVGTNDSIGFDALRVDGEYERNLLAGRKDFLPFRLAFGAESDSSFNLVNGVVRGSLDYVLPWNPNFSPRDDGYIPSVGPLLRLVAETGVRLSEDASSPDAVTAPERFERLGYEVRWTFPVARDTKLTFHHAGLWVFSNDLDEDEHHDLWDLVLETRIGNLSYYVGYQEGEAAPLFVPTETTQVGVLMRIGDHFQCAKADGASQWSCGSP